MTTDPLAIIIIIIIIIVIIITIISAIITVIVILTLCLIKSPSSFLGYCCFFRLGSVEPANDEEEE